MKSIYLAIICIMLLLYANNVNSTDNNGTQEFINESVTPAKINKKNWQNLKERYVYETSDEIKFIEETESNNNNNLNLNRRSNDFSMKDFLTILGVLALFIIILYAGFNYKIIAPSSKNIQRQQMLSADSIEDNLMQANVRGALDKAEGEEDLKLAIRLFYLRVLKKLVEAGLLVWKKDKTNGKYLRELKNNKYKYHTEFSNLTRIFEYVWYSDMVLSKGQYLEIKQSFDHIFKD